MMVVDVSSSMLAEDFKPKNRLGAAKAVASEFIEGRRNDPIGLVVFAGAAVTLCPLTLDHEVVQVGPRQIGESVESPDHKARDRPQDDGEADEYGSGEKPLPNGVR